MKDDYNHKYIEEIVEISDGNNILFNSKYPIKLIINKKPDLRKNNKSPEIALWQAVIIQALEDATSNSKKKKQKLYKKRACNWLNSESECKEVCNLAGIKYNGLLKLMEQIWI